MTFFFWKSVFIKWLFLTKSHLPRKQFFRFVISPRSFKKFCWRFFYVHQTSAQRETVLAWTMRSFWFLIEILEIQTISKICRQLNTDFISVFFCSLELYVQTIYVVCYVNNNNCILSAGFEKIGSASFFPVDGIKTKD